ncbi:condensin-2 complex subunit G2 [Pontoporia blainvillei]|uniref:Condensin-2 complex subunit G2 n=1 Tax=Pontoporia blainvillei TaxID=48723 RepID=A0ABX0S8W7_PONBL|nr:condensin-2 complex subunit G2 [Pontoporia blainvillei]
MENNKEAKVYTVSKFASMLPEYMKAFKFTFGSSTTAFVTLDLLAFLSRISVTVMSPSSILPLKCKRDLSVKDDRCKTPLSVLASLMPASAVPTFRNQEEGTADKSYCILLDCLCSWGQVGHILELVCDSLPEEQPQSKGNSASKRRVQVQDPRPVKPGLALVYVEYLLTHPKNRECLLSAPQKKLNRLLKALETSKQVVFRAQCPVEANSEGEPVCRKRPDSRKTARHPRSPCSGPAHRRGNSSPLSPGQAFLGPFGERVP